MILYLHHLISVALVFLASANCYLKLIPCEMVNHVLGLLGAVGVVQLHGMCAAKVAKRQTQIKKSTK